MIGNPFTTPANYPSSDYGTSVANQLGATPGYPYDPHANDARLREMLGIPSHSESFSQRRRHVLGERPGMSRRLLILLTEH